MTGDNTYLPGDEAMPVDSEADQVVPTLEQELEAAQVTATENYDLFQPSVVVVAKRDVQFPLGLRAYGSKPTIKRQGKTHIRFVSGLHPPAHFFGELN